MGCRMGWGANLLASLLVSVMFSGSAIAYDSGKDLKEDGGSRAERIGGEDPAYPAKALNRIIEGWVAFSFVVETDGTTSNVQIIDSSPSGVFEETVITAVESWTYKPATSNEKPTRSGFAEYVFTFHIYDSRLNPKKAADRMAKYKGRASAKFSKIFERAQKAIDDKEFAEAWNLIEELEELKTLNQYENSFISIIKSRYYVANDDVPLAMRSMRRALYADGDHLGRKERGKFLKYLFELQIGDRSWYEALKTYDKLDGLKVLKKSHEIHETAKSIRAFLDSDKVFSRDGKITDVCPECNATVPMWSHPLYRKTFYVHEISGTISRFALYCGNHWAEVSFNPELTYSTVEKWGECTIHVYGSEGTTFKLVEQ